MKTNNDLLDHAVRIFPAPERAFDRLSRRRDRRRRSQRVTAGVVGITVFAALAFALFGAIRSQPSQSPGDTQPIDTTQTSIINGITITHPEAWFVADPVDIGMEAANEARTLPSLILVLSSLDPSTPATAACPGLADGAAGTALMTVQEQPLTLIGQGSAPWPVSLGPMDLGEDATGASRCYPGWVFQRATWTAAGRSFEAVAGFGPEATESDRDALLDAYASMSFSPESNTPSVLDTDGLERELKTQIGKQTKAKVTSLECPPDVEIEAGGTFECSAEDASGGMFTIRVTQGDDPGTLTWEVADVQG